MGRKQRRGVGAAFCVMTDINITHIWSARLSLRNTVFQVKILALLKAVEHAVALPTQQLTILVDNQAGIQLAANPKSHNSIARKIFRLLHSHPHIRVSWIKAHVGYIGNEESDRLVKEATETEKFRETPLEIPKFFIKTFLCQKMMATWQMAWNDGDTGRLIHRIIPKVSFQPINWTRNEVLFSTGHGAFPSYLQRFNLAETSFCSCGGIGTPIHYATECLLTVSYYMAPPNQQHQSVWFRGIAKYSIQEGRTILCSTFSKVKPVFYVQTPINYFFPFFISLLSVECNVCDPIPKFLPVFSQIATSVTKHPLPPAMREFKTSRTSIVCPTSSSLPHLTILFLWR
ncbi:hypothetical protein AVEN_84042-1 [Araneus ventricosus]|uniref:RNase H type-1 domain-containing protein n=1 Tax=Araneus ventricosus TaxID=182803 RepID=A0A4Y2KSL0_ARAVE|nr:hypothetical protein AVEN_84042-1 [Araneus ventricosus]